jgi:hypothetical protein
VRPAGAALLVGTLTLLVAPAVWSGISVQAAGSGMAAGLPAAGPATGGVPGGVGQARDGRNVAPGQNPVDDGQARGNGGQASTGVGALPGSGSPAGPGGGPGMGQVDAQLLQWLIAHRGDAEYLVAMSSANQAAPIIIQTGLPVMATGGFSGGDPILTADTLARLVQDGTVRYFLAGGGPGGRGGADGGASVNVNTWVTRNCTAVPATELGGASQQLYDCGAAR